MNRLVTLAVGAGAFAAVAAGCGSSSTTSSPSSTPTSPPASATGAATVKTASSPLGQIVVDGSGRTLYEFKADTGTTPTCTGSCASTWPPDLTAGQPHETGLNGTLGTTPRTDLHATQVTLDGHPLYYYSGDAAPGDVNGQGIMSTWFAVNPSGTTITTTPSPSTSGGGSGGYGY
jgi:predicted lipoprotein with Yx(FWY)xxD motif